MCAFTSTPPSSLKHIIRMTITNSVSLTIIDTIEAMGHGRVLKATFLPNGDTATSFRALIGTPNGAGGVYLLMQHKVSLGLKTISKIILVRAKITLKPHLIFELEDLKLGHDMNASRLIPGNQTRTESMESRGLPALCDFGNAPMFSE